MTTIEQYALELVRLKVAEREAMHKVPTVASLRDITSMAVAEITEAIESLVAKGILHRTENVNRVPMYAPKESDK